MGHQETRNVDFAMRLSARRKIVSLIEHRQRAEHVVFHETAVVLMELFEHIVSFASERLRTFRIGAESSISGIRQVLPKETDEWIASWEQLDSAQRQSYEATIRVERARNHRKKSAEGPIDLLFASSPIAKSAQKAVEEAENIEKAMRDAYGRALDNHRKSTEMLLNGITYSINDILALLPEDDQQRRVLCERIDVAVESTRSAWHEHIIGEAGEFEETVKLMRIISKSGAAN